MSSSIYFENISLQRQRFILCFFRFSYFIHCKRRRTFFVYAVFLILGKPIFECEFQRFNRFIVSHFKICYVKYGRIDFDIDLNVLGSVYIESESDFAIVFSNLVFRFIKRGFRDRFFGSTRQDRTARRIQHKLDRYL